METKIEMGKQYKTRDGREVRIYATDCMGMYTVHGAVKNNGEWNIQMWAPCGTYVPGSKGMNDLIEVKPRIVRECWTNVYLGGLGVMHATKAKADAGRSDGCIACVKITIDCEEGEGLNDGA